MLRSHHLHPLFRKDGHLCELAPKGQVPHANQQIQVVCQRADIVIQLHQFDPEQTYESMEFCLQA